MDVLAKHLTRHLRDDVASALYCASGCATNCLLKMMTIAETASGVCVCCGAMLLTTCSWQPTASARSLTSLRKSEHSQASDSCSSDVAALTGPVRFVVVEIAKLFVSLPLPASRAPEAGALARLAACVE